MDTRGGIVCFFFFACVVSFLSVNVVHDLALTEEIDYQLQAKIDAPKEKAVANEQDDNDPGSNVTKRAKSPMQIATDALNANSKTENQRRQGAFIKQGERRTHGKKDTPNATIAIGKHKQHHQGSTHHQLSGNTTKEFESRSQDRTGKQKYQGSDHFLASTWPSLQRAICNDGIPNQKRGARLAELFFELGREEAFVYPDLELKRTSKHPSQKLSRKFYENGWLVTAYNSSSSFQTIYVTAWKCANQQIRKMEKKLFADKERFDGHYTENVISLEEALKRVGVWKSSRKLESPPCIYTAIRDPISHFLSGYNEVEYRMLIEFPNWNNTGGNRPDAPYHFAVPYTYTSDIGGRVPKANPPKEIDHDRLHRLRKKRFSAFVKDFLREDDAIAKNHEYQHVYSMTRMLNLLAHFKQRFTDYIPSIVNITTTWPAFISGTCPGAPPVDEFPNLHVDGQHDSSRDLLGLYKAAKDVWKEGGPIARALCLLHAFDYACWTKLPEGIPDVCMKVYHEHQARILETSRERSNTRSEA